MKKVLLLNPPFDEILVRDNYCCHTSKGDYVWAPSDLLYVSGTLNVPEIELYVLDAIVEKMDLESVENHLRQIAPDVIVTLSGTVSFSTDMELLKKMRENLGCRNYLMGNLPVFNAELVLERYPHIDGIFHNFFDTRVLNHILDPSFLCNSISHRTVNGSFHLGKVNYLEKGQQPSPRVPRFDLFPNEKYSTPISNRSPQTTVITAFGCPYECKFCVASGLNLYNRDLENLEAEFDEIKRNGIKEIFFMDSTFNSILNRLRKICNLMIEKKYGFSWSCNVHSLKYSQRDFELMKKAGCHTIQIGVEAGNEDSRNEFAPTKSEENLKGVFDQSHKAGLRTLGYFIIGFPQEDKDMVKETIDFALELDPFFASFTTLMPDYGTEFYLEARDKQMIDKGLHYFDNSGKPILKNMLLSKDEREKLLKLAYRKFYFRPRQVWKYVSDFKHFPLYFRNGSRVLKKFLLS